MSALRLLGELYNESGYLDSAERVLREADEIAQSSYSSQTQETTWSVFIDLYMYVEFKYNSYMLFCRSAHIGRVFVIERGRGRK